MPKAAARIWLRINDVRVERVQSISTANMIKEGVRIPVDANGCTLWELGKKDSAFSFMSVAKVIESDIHARLWSFWAELWCQINGRPSWDANPWVWVIDFQRIDKPLNK